MHNVLPHDRSEFFESDQYKISVIDFFLRELRQDGTDITSVLFVESALSSTANIVAKQSGVLAGQSEIDFFLNAKECFLDIKIDWNKTDGSNVKNGDIICKFSGNALDILRFERVSLNLLSRLSGIATATRLIQEKSITPIAATRKTQWSYLDKKAVHVGGGNTHRMGLFDAVLVKENHLISGTKKSVLQKMLHFENYASNEVLSSMKFIEVEVETVKEFYEVFSLFLNKSFDVNKQYQYVIMLDNFSPKDIASLLLDLETVGHNGVLYSKKIRNKNNIFIEISGGITAENITNYSNLGADVISLGALTHSVMPLDFSLRF